jgi:hypothetical protein
MKYRNIDIPDELTPEKEMVDMATKTDLSYIEQYDAIMRDNDGNKNMTACDAIALMSKVATEHIALCIGANLRDYDKDLLLSIIERHIAQVVFKES